MTNGRVIDSSLSAICLRCILKGGNTLKHDIKLYKTKTIDKRSAMWIHNDRE